MGSELSHRIQKAMPSRSEMNGQQWETVTFNTKPSVAKTTVLAPHNNQRPTPSMSKVAGTTNQQLEDETEILKHQTVPTELKRAIMQARNAKSMTQKQLALLLGCEAKLVQDYEAGKAIPNNAMVAKMERVLGAKLPRAPKK